MIVKKERFNKCCDMNYCDNLADILIENDLVEKFEAGADTKNSQKFYLCEHCAKELAEKLSAFFVPKTIKSVYNNQEKF